MLFESYLVIEWSKWSTTYMVCVGNIDWTICFKIEVFKKVMSAIKTIVRYISYNCRVFVVISRAVYFGFVYFEHAHVFSTVYYTVINNSLFQRF